jgi:beta-lactamase superfamily II metal-dependent hydrolase
MEYVIDFIYVGDGDALIVWARDPNVYDYVIFIDGGNAGNGQKIVDHYHENIEPYLMTSRSIGFINSHPHNDHINGLIEVVELLGSKMNFAIYNDPVEFISEELREQIKKSYLAKEDDDITHLYESFQKVLRLNELCKEHNLKKLSAFRETNLLGDDIKILSPSKEYYQGKVQQFTNIDFLKKEDFSIKVATVFDDEISSPCTIVDEINDASPENLSSTVIQLTDSSGKKYILTADAGVESFDDMDKNGFDNENINLVQLPHHGSRRNISSAWLQRFKPHMFIVSAAGNVKHPRRAVVNCIKRNLPNTFVYSTHTSKNTLSYTTNREVFPNRGWGSATPL